MQRLLIITLSLIMVYLNIGYYLQVNVQKEMAKQEMKERILTTIPDSAFAIFELNSIEKQVTWQENGKEFWFNGELYDLVKTGRVNGKTYIYCLNDKSEGKIVANYLKNANKESKNAESKGAKSIFSVLFISNAGLRAHIISTVIEHKYPSYVQQIQQRCKEIFLPPPQA